MQLQHLQKRLTVVVRRVEIASGGYKHADEPAEIVRTHAAVGIQQHAVISVCLLTHRGLVEKSADSLVVPVFINNFFFIGTHFLRPAKLSCNLSYRSLPRLPELQTGIEIRYITF